jgi:two-component sensor histidine kinase
MTTDDGKAEQIETLLETPDLANALENEAFLRFLDHIPIALIVSAMTGDEQIIYVNPEFERLSGQPASDVMGRPWSVLRGQATAQGDGRDLGAAIVDATDFIGTFRIDRDPEPSGIVDAYSNLIGDEQGTPLYRLAALADVGVHEQGRCEAFEQQLREKDILLLEIQHRVKNNLQMITALIRIEARNASGRIDTAPFDRLAGRIESIQLLYKSLSDHGQGDEIDLGLYLSDIASSVLHSHAVEGIRLDLKVDVFPVSVNVALPTGLVVNELLTNAIKHAFTGRHGGTITLHSLSDGQGCRVVIADDGIGLPDGVIWPMPGKLSAMIVQSLRTNAKASLDVESGPGQGMRVTIAFTRAAAGGA